MSTKEEYERVYGPVPEGTTPATEWGPGGCYIITRAGSSDAIGRWPTVAAADEVLSKLAKGHARQYELTASHHIVPSAGGNLVCKVCGMNTTAIGVAIDQEESK